MNKNELIDIIRDKTNGTFIGEFNDCGKLNNLLYNDSTILIGVDEYFITRINSHVWIWNGKYNYNTAISIGKNSNDPKVLAELDLTPRYIRNSVENDIRKDNGIRHILVKGQNNNVPNLVMIKILESDWNKLDSNKMPLVRFKVLSNPYIGILCESVKEFSVHWRLDHTYRNTTLQDMIIK